MNDYRHGLRYRPDIDGLRALAVVAVVLFHADVPRLGGGFVGVDVFFVISGYLITTGLIADPSIVNFYQRRARRILPALFFMLAVVLAVGFFILLPQDYVEMAESAATAIAFSSNIWFWRQSDYFARGTELWPLLHSWSLGVEEQFYIAFPFLVKIFGRLQKPRLALVFAICAAASLAAAIFWVDQGRGSFAFYQSPLRAWELLLGSILATGAIPPLRHSLARSLVAMIGLAGILISIVAVELLPPFPGFGALPSVIGAACLIYAGAGGKTWLTPVLAAKPVVAIGLISYSLYLWHWPVLALARYVAIEPLSPWQVAAALAVALGLAWLSWRFVERPFRNPAVANRTIWIGSLSGMATLGAAAIAIPIGQGFPARFSSTVVRLNAGSGATWRCPLPDFISFGDYLACPITLPNRDARTADVVLWGDSHAQMYAPAVRMAAGRHRVLLVNAYGCAPVLGDAISASCGTIQRGNYAEILKLPAPTVIVAQNWPQYRDEATGRLGRTPLPSERYQDGIRRLRALVAGLRANGKRVIIVAPVAVPGFNVASVASRELLFRGRITTPIKISRRQYEAEYANVLAAMRDLARDPNVHIVRIDQRACSATHCPFLENDEAVFADYGHFSTRAVTRFAPMFRDAIAAAAGER